jgi:hypothetical protein
MKDNTLWIFGDSFADEDFWGSNSWPQLLIKSFYSKNKHISPKKTKIFCDDRRDNPLYVRYSQPSIDVHTIIETFLANLYQIKENDFVVIVLPTISRVRIPIIDFFPPKTQTNKRIDDRYNRFLFEGESHLDYQRKETRDLIESPINLMDYNEYLKIIEGMLLFNSSDAELDSINKVLYSLKKSFNFGIYLMSWEDELDSTIVDTRDVLTEKIGFWETLANLYERGDDVPENYKNNFHWSERMDGAVANYIIKTYPKYFKEV